MTKQDEPVASRNVLEMLTVAHEYCLFTEKADTYTQEEILDYMQKICPLLYLKGTLLPDIVPEYPEANERYITEEQWENVFKTLKEKFGEYDQYWYHDYNSIDINDPIKGSLADNFADIYQDLKDFTLLFQKNSIAAKENAIAELKQLFVSHWGFRLVTAHRYLHYLLMARKKPQAAEDTPNLVESMD
ncbi:MAG: DUF5063 domain-containing protein [Bacteroidia bacterium]|nr:DUF5063 domain-containing protein [Bacteroidia bacterium]